MAQSVPLTNGNVLAAYYRTDGYAVWAWYLELAPSDSRWRPVAVLYHEFLCVSFDWHGEGSLTGAVTVDSQVDRSVRCALDLKTGAAADCSLSFRVDPRVDSQPLRDYLSRGLVESLGRSMR